MEPNKFHLIENILYFYFGIYKYHLHDSMMKDEIYLKKLGDKIVRLREEKDISQRELARRIKTNNTQIRRIETGIVNSSINMLRKIAKEFDITISELVDIS